MGLLEEIRGLAQQLATTDDEDVRDAADLICRDYRRERLVALGLAAVDALVSDGSEEIDEDDPGLVALRERLRDRLKSLLAWVRQTRSM